MTEPSKWDRFLDCLAWVALGVICMIPAIVIVGCLVVLTIDTPWAGGLASAYVLSLIVVGLSCNRLNKRYR